MITTGIILAGGKSSRMGEDKSMLTINDKTLIAQMVDTLKRVPAIGELIIVSNEKNKYNFADIKEISDIYPRMGPLSGIHAGLVSAKYDYSFITACDMPFMNSELVDYIIKQSVEFDVTLPLINNNLEPLCAVYSKNCLPHIENSLEKNIRRVFDFYSHVKVNHLNESELKEIVDTAKVFFNVNTPNDYRNIKTR